VVVGILAYYARGRGFESRTLQTFVCMYMSVCIGSGGSMYNIQKKVTKYLQNKCIKVYNILIRYLESITSLVLTLDKIVVSLSRIFII
jgi:hypothetical protein